MYRKRIVTTTSNYDSSNKLLGRTVVESVETVEDEDYLDDDTCRCEACCSIEDDVCLCDECEKLDTCDEQCNIGLSASQQCSGCAGCTPKEEPLKEQKIESEARPKIVVFGSKEEAPAELIDLLNKLANLK